MTKTITITVTEDTEKRLKYLCEKLGLRKSQAIAYAVNTTAMEKYDFDVNKGENANK